MRNIPPNPVPDGITLKPTPQRCVELDREHLRRQRIIAGYGPCQYVDAYKVLRTRVLQKMRERGWSSLAVTSPHANAGKTVAAINLAFSLALEVNQTVLLADANLRKPGLRQCLGLPDGPGLADHLLDQTPVENILLRLGGIGQLLVLPGSRPLADSAEMSSSPRMAELVRSLKTEAPSRLAVYDLPDLQTADALAFLPLADAVLLVVEAGGTTDEELAQAMEHLQGTPVVGTLLNKAEIS